MATILLIEDDDIMLKAIRNILTRDGHEVLSAKDGKEAFDKLDNAQYDIVMSDLMMPYANGLEVVSRLRNDPNRRHVGIIICSSVGNEETITEAFRLGADDYLKKPIMAGELLIRIKKLIANRNAGAKLVTKKK
ncbi:MAG: response regulator [Chitinophagia bacterium]|nr:response regulator [Chitinophagia bacterium]